MPIKRISIETFLGLVQDQPIFDVRSPGEYGHAHIPSAYSLPLFTDEERKVVGILYKQQGRERAIKEGLDYFGPKMRAAVESVEKTLKERGQSSSKRILLHCWRGGMRSGAIAWLLDLYGFEVTVLEGGYKAYRNWVLEQFEKAYSFKILGGYTGSGKTEILQAIGNTGAQMIDLENLAAHKGSAFGALGQPPQPTQEMFENMLAMRLSQLKEGACWLEDESQRIGRLNIPHPLWNTIRSMPVYFVDIPREERIKHIQHHYGTFDPDQLIAAVERIQKRLGGMETKNCISYLQEGNTAAAFEILLVYYDKWYFKGLNSREELEKKLTRLPFEKMDIQQIVHQLLHQ
jgi:tRNA 2-selenouridine synthase